MLDACPFELSVISDAACRAGDAAREARKKLSPAQIHAKDTRADLVTDVDRATESRLREILGKAYPEFGFYGEEFGVTQAESLWRFVIDPIDGTTSFVQGLANYSVSIALQYQKRSVAAVVYAPKLGELFCAEAGKGATLNGEAIHVSATAELGDAALATGFACLRAKAVDNNLPAFCRIAPQLRGIYRLGSAALDLAYTACGRFDGFWESHLALYDIAAGELLVREGGGRVTDFHGGEAFPQQGILSTNGTPIHELLLQEL